MEDFGLVVGFRGRQPDVRVAFGRWTIMQLPG